MREMRKAIVHGRRIKEPYISSFHHVQPKRPEDGEIHGRVRLLHEPHAPRLGPDLEPDGERLQEHLHAEFARKGQQHDVEREEREVLRALAVLHGAVRPGGERVRDEERGMQRVGYGRIA